MHLCKKTKHEEREGDPESLAKREVAEEQKEEESDEGSEVGEGEEISPEEEGMLLLKMKELEAELYGKYSVGILYDEMCRTDQCSHIYLQKIFKRIASAMNESFIEGIPTKRMSREDMMTFLENVHPE